MTFENDEDKARERKAITLFVSQFGGSFKKLDKHDIDYEVFDKDDNPIAFVEIKGRKRTIEDAYPLPIAAAKLIKLCNKGITPVVVWSCEDGLIYGKVKNLYGKLSWGGRPPRVGSFNDDELMVYYSDQKEFKTILFP